MDLSRLKIESKRRTSSRRRVGRWLAPAAVLLVLAGAVWLIGGNTVVASIAERVFGGGRLAVDTERAVRIQAAAGAELTTASGYVVPRKTASLGSKVLGRVAKLFVEPGDRVTRDQVLAELEHEDLDAALEAAKADHLEGEAAVLEADKRAEQAVLEVAKAKRSLEVADLLAKEALARQEDAARELVRVEGLFAKNQSSQRQLDNARAEQRAWTARHQSLIAAHAESEVALDTAKHQVEIDKAIANVKRAREKALAARVAQAAAIVDDAMIRAPFDGVILRKDAEVGEIVAPSPGGSTLSRSAVFTMADFSTLELEVDVIERDIHLIETGGPAQLRLDGYPDQPLPGRVRLVLPTADRQKATIQVKVAFDAIPSFARPEMSGSALFLKAEAAARATERSRVLIATAAVVRVDDDTRVWIVRDGAAKAKSVELGARAGARVEVKRGLTGGEELIVSPPDDLTDGTRVRITNQER